MVRNLLIPLFVPAVALAALLVSYRLGPGGIPGSTAGRIPAAVSVPGAVPLRCFGLHFRGDGSVEVTGYRADDPACPSDVTIPSAATSVGKRAFWEKGIDSAVIPRSVKSVGEEAFGANPSLFEVCIEAAQGSITVAGDALPSGATVLYQSDCP